MQEKDKSKFQGISANAILLPLEITMVILIILIIILVIEVNRSSNKLSDLLEKAGIYQQETWDMQSGVNTLSETISNFIQRPVAEDGSFNINPLAAYAQELNRNRRGPQIAERFRSYGISDEAQAYLDHAAGLATEMIGIQDHAIALMRSVYPFPPIPELTNIPDVPLTEEDLSMPEEARIGYAKKLLLDQQYAQTKFFIAEDINSCNNIFSQEFTKETIETKKHVKTLRTVLWIVIFSIVVLLLFIFTVIRLWLIRPLRRHTKEISSDKKMIQASGIREMRVLVNAYNALLNRRNRLESILRSAAETDSLTGLPNRYSLKRYELEADEDSGPMAVIMFDVNYLKQVNDTHGHLAGDKLIRTAGECIRDCFGMENGSCYRLGGDEFAAVLRKCSEEDVKSRLDRFALAQEREKISVSVGYAFSGNTDEDTFKKLFDEADRRMYTKKKQMHESGNSPFIKGNISMDRVSE